MTMRLVAEQITTEGFAPFGDLLAAPSAPGRSYFDGALHNGRATAHPSLSIVHCLPVASLPLTVTKLERHQYSSQSFIPLGGGAKLLVVCPHIEGVGPDLSALRAFVTLPSEGITYRPNIWHHSLTILGQPGFQAVMMWKDGTNGDEEFVDVPPFTVEVSAAGETRNDQP
jgi:ureidoglycolate lyase